MDASGGLGGEHAEYRQDGHHPRCHPGDSGRSTERNGRESDWALRVYFEQQVPGVQGVACAVTGYLPGCTRARRPAPSVRTRRAGR